MEMPSNEILLKLYRELLTARRGEQRMFEIVGRAIFPTGHRGVGEEVVPIAICNNLTETDCFHPNFRTAFCLFTKPGFSLTDVVGMNLGRVPKHHPFFAPQYGTLGSSGTLGEPAVIYLGVARRRQRPWPHGWGPGSTRRRLGRRRLRPRSSG